MNGTITARIRDVLDLRIVRMLPAIAAPSGCPIVPQRSGQSGVSGVIVGPPRWPRRAASCHDALGALAVWCGSFPASLPRAAYVPLEGAASGRVALYRWRTRPLPDA